MFKIEKNVPITRGFRRGRPSKYPFLDMEVGDSFAFEVEMYKKVAAAAFTHGKNHGSKFSVSLTSLRCWRVS